MALVAQPASSIKSVEKAIRILLLHISRGPNGSPHAGQIHEALTNQGARMEKAAAEEKARKNGSLDHRKRPPSAPAEDQSDSKRLKTEHGTSSAAATASFLATVDFTKLPLSLITDLVVANLQVFTEPTLNTLIQAYQQKKPQPQTAPTAAIASTSAPVPQTSTSTVVPPTRPSEPEPEVRRVKEEPVDPLQMDIDDEEFEFEPDRLNQNVCTRQF